MRGKASARWHSWLSASLWFQRERGFQYCQTPHHTILTMFEFMDKMWTVKVKVVTRCILLLFKNNGTVKWSSSNSSHVTSLLLGMWPTHLQEVSKKVSSNWRKKLFEKIIVKVLILSFYPDGVGGYWLIEYLALIYFDSQEWCIYLQCVHCTMAMSKFDRERNWALFWAI